jgi:hypothetical protein
MQWKWQLDLLKHCCSKLASLPACHFHCIRRGWVVVDILAKGKSTFKGTYAFFDGIVEFNVQIVDCFDVGIVVSIYVDNVNGINVGIINGFNVGIVDR